MSFWQRVWAAIWPWAKTVLEIAIEAAARSAVEQLANTRGVDGDGKREEAVALVRAQLDASGYRDVPDRFIHLAIERAYVAYREEEA